MSQWGFYFNQNRCIGCKACTMACKNWNEKNRGDRVFNAYSEASISADSVVSAVNESDMQPSAIFADSTGALPTALLSKTAMKEEWRKVTEHDSGGIRIDTNTNTYYTTFERAYLSLACNHCTEPACMAACPMGVYYKDAEYGLTLYNSGSCISCGKCRQACPWDVPQHYDPNYANFASQDPKRPLMTKCTGCRDRIKEGLKTACVAACRARALDFGPLDELRTKYNNNVIDKVEGFDPSSTKPNIIFRAKTNKIGQM